MDAYVDTLNGIGESIINWSDPDSQFTGFTKVSVETPIDGWREVVSFLTPRICIPTHSLTN